MKYIKINKDNLEILELFLNNAGSSKKYFRYYESRDLSVVDKHIYTIVGLDNDQNPICYGHLDQEKESVWLGICVKEGETGKGLGKKIMDKLIEYAVSENIKEIKLSVDNINKPAINLYLRTGFKLEKKDKDKSFYILKTDGLELSTE